MVGTPHDAPRSQSNPPGGAAGGGRASCGRRGTDSDVGKARAALGMRRAGAAAVGIPTTPGGAGSPQDRKAVRLDFDMTAPARPRARASTGVPPHSPSSPDAKHAARTSRPAETSAALPFKTSKVYECDAGGLISLSVCPGKQLTKGRNGRRYERCLRQDLLTAKERARVTHIVCLLNPSELRCLGVPPDTYKELCGQLGIEFVHYPMIEMAAPPHPSDLDRDVVAPMVREVLRGGSVLIHCRGGVGRAGLQAACMVLRLGEAASADEAVAIIRQRRDPRAVESQTQLTFVNKYATWLALNHRKLEDLAGVGVLPPPRTVRAAQPGVQIGNAMKQAKGAHSPRGRRSASASASASPRQRRSTSTRPAVPS
eukprot:TRINITY_DN1878_c0_g1_i1.p1 TRINITY_DN1878_c0_g1~~TRINITY_DN1878_c0_g1_i1.p1  ORF type:complete len:370 (+),score=109.58 TRINITY_DN1878_c0_g1_i1:40-1149(+)